MADGAKIEMRADTGYGAGAMLSVTRDAMIRHWQSHRLLLAVKRRIRPRAPSHADTRCLRRA